MGFRNFEGFGWRLKCLGKEMKLEYHQLVGIYLHWGYRGLMLKGRLQAGYFIIHSKIEKGDEISSIVYKPWKMEVSKLS